MVKFNFPKGATEIDDISGLKILGVKHLADLNLAEAENIFSAQSIYLKPVRSEPSKWFNIHFLRKVHVAMFGRVWSWAGIWRRSHTNIGVVPQLIPLRIAELIEEVYSWAENPFDLSLVDRSVRIHHKLVSIHPYENGNGRFARLIGDRYLLCQGHTHPTWPQNLGRDGEVREQYISALKEADLGDYTSLSQFTHKHLT